jgi:hypothetical protein
VIRTTTSLFALAGALFCADAASAQTAAALDASTTPAGAAQPNDAQPDTPPSDIPSTIVITGRSTRSSTELPGTEIQKILPGVSPLKAIQTLPGVLYITADPWGYTSRTRRSSSTASPPTSSAIRWTACRWATRAMAITTASPHSAR